jgi:hypothetical protein
MSIANSNIDQRDWSALTTGERIRMIEVEGYLVLPDLISPDELANLKAQTATWPTDHVDYSEKQRVRKAVQFEGGSVTHLIGQSKTLDFLRVLFGDEVLMTHYDYARSEPGHPGISLHTDGQPYGSEIFGFEGSCPHLVRVLYYPDDLTLDVSPFRVLPRSHLSMHAQANPYLRYEDHPGVVTVPVTAGSAVLINHKVFHGNQPNGRVNCWRSAIVLRGRARSSRCNRGLKTKLPNCRIKSSRSSLTAIRGTGTSKAVTNP